MNAACKPGWFVAVDVDKRGGDDDVFTVSALVRAATADEAMKLAEKACADRYGAENVLGAFNARAA